MNAEYWIPVCERLPAVSEPVLTYDEASRTRSIAFLNNGRWLRDYPDPMLRVEVQVTHWQPLPELPPKPDPFEDWWELNRESLVSLLIENPREAAHVIWDRAIASTENK